MVMFYLYMKLSTFNFLTAYVFQLEQIFLEIKLIT